MKPQTIDEVLQEMDGIIERSIHEKSFLGIFAYIYRQTTARIKEEIEQGNFENNDRLSGFDVVFANFYLDAFRKYREGEPVTESWRVAFEAQNKKLTIIQHLLLGMNAHINLDLAITASEVMDKKPIAELENDFIKVNDILAGLLDEMQSKIAKASMMMFLLDWIGKRTDEEIINFSIKEARKQSWRLANEIWSLEGAAKEYRIKQADRSIGEIGNFISKPKSGLLRFVLKIIGRFEPAEPAAVINKLKL
ncbi:MAG: hypothetical protein JW731_16310 [Bacteroidales bacterium]|nr:hypothetical protein [Bacteroidales bacterium]